MEKKFYIGLDVHKKSTTYVVRDWNGGIAAKGACATRFEDIHILLESYLTGSSIGMEASTCYYSLYRDLKKEKIDVHVANTLQLRKLVAKSDPLDAQRLADMLRLNTFPESYIPNEQIQLLRSLVGLRQRFVKEKVGLKNQIHAVLDKQGIRFSGKTSFTQQWNTQLEKCIMETNTCELRYLYEAYKDAAKRVGEVTTNLVQEAKKQFPEHLQNLKSIPGIGEVWASYLLAFIMPINRFSDKRKLRRYAGVIPVTNSSGGKDYGTYIPKSASRTELRLALVEAAFGAVRSEGNLKYRFEKKIREGGKKQKAIMAIASSICDIVWHLLTKNQQYTPTHTQSITQTGGGGIELNMNKKMELV